MAEFIVNDCTLREGEQAACANFSLSEKLEIAERLYNLGIRQIQGGYPGRSEDDAAVVSRLKEIGFTVEVVCQIFTEDWRDQIDRCLACEPDIVDLMYPASAIRLRHVQEVDESTVLARIHEGTGRACVQGESLVRFAPTDSTRAEPEFLFAAYETALAAGAQRISVADTAGVAGPRDISSLVSAIAERFDVPIQLHCHNDLGLALANTVAGIEAGATILDATVNGLGERSGNTSLDELIVVLVKKYGVSEDRFDLSMLTSMARFVAELSKTRISSMKPLVGENAFAHKLDAHVRGVLRHPAVYEPITPEELGNERRFPIGKYSGPSVLQARLQQLGLNTEGVVLEEVAERVSHVAIEQHAELSDQQVKEAAAGAEDRS